MDHVALLVKTGAPPSFWASIEISNSDYASLTWVNFLLKNRPEDSVLTPLGVEGFVQYAR